MAHVSSSPFVFAVLAHLLLFTPAVWAGADENARSGFDRDGTVALPTTSLGDPCLFFRGQIHERGLRAFAYDMLLVCEEIARRRDAGVRLTDRLQASEETFQTYHQAVVAAGRAERTGGTHRYSGAPWSGLSSEEKVAIADATGALLVLEAMREGF